MDNNQKQNELAMPFSIYLAIDVSEKIPGENPNTTQGATGDDEVNGLNTYTDDCC